MKNSDISGWVSQIQSFSVNDGEGIRTTIFLSGCPLRCKWCSNPETWDLKLGTQMTVKQVLERIKRDIIFFRTSGGGITFSGGEPTFQLHFLKALVDEFYNMGIDMTIETSGYFEWEQASSIFEKLDFVFIDIKHMESEAHRTLTGVDNNIILKNIEYLGSMEKQVVIRIPLMKGINDSYENIRDTANFVKEKVRDGRIEILPYHNLGAHKYKDLGLEKHMNTFETPAKEDVEQIKKIIISQGVENIDYK